MSGLVHVWNGFAQKDSLSRTGKDRNKNNGFSMAANGYYIILNIII
jgi:hypothetical protein